MRLFREVRCALPAAPSAADQGSRLQPLNSWAGTSGDAGGGPFWFLRVMVEGQVDERTGYLCDIRSLDGLLRGPVLQSLLFLGTGETLRGLAAVAGGLSSLVQSSTIAWPNSTRLVRLEVAVTPFTKLSVFARKPNMVHLTQSFEFSAAHRLYCPDLSDDENQRLFGKCSNPHGHGHNYVLEVTMRGQPDDRIGAVTDLKTLDEMVRRCVIEPFDHRNLNTECADFATVNPTVENIAKAIWNRLAGEFVHCSLAQVRVWETPKTFAEYSGEGSE